MKEHYHPMLAKISLCSFIFLAFLQNVISQSQQSTIDLKYEETPMVEALKDASDKTGTKLFYRAEWFDGLTLTFNRSFASEKRAIEALLDHTNIKYDFIQGNVYVLYNKESENKIVRDTITITGVVTDYLNNERIPNATVSIPDLNQGPLTDLDGKYTLQIIEGTYMMSAKSLSSEASNLVAQLYQDTVINFEIFDEVTLLDDVVVTSANPIDNIEESTTGKIIYSVESIKKLPTLLGEVDLSRIILSLPGVQTVGEGASGFNVRGGAIDQNLILLDQMPIYNSSHLLGFFSIFNADMINDFTIYKGNLPARFGGRLSSVVDVSVKNPDNENFTVSGGVGPIANKLNINVPIVKEKAAITTGVRYSDPTWILRGVDDVDVSQSSGRFYDINSKIAVSLSDKSLLTSTIYASDDLFDFGRDSVYDYRSQMAGLNFSHQLSGNLFGQVNFYLSNYEAGLETKTENLQSDFKNGIRTVGGSIQFDYSSNTLKNISFGADTKWSTYNLGEIRPSTPGSFIQESNFGERASQEYGVFVENEYQLTRRVKVKAGLRGSFFFIRENDLPVFQEGLARSQFTVLDSLNSGRYRNLYNNIEPRASINWNINATESIKASYNRSIQYKHLFSNSAASLPTDLWLPSSNNLTFAAANLFTVGYFKNLSDNTWEFSSEVYYKHFPKFNIANTGSQILQNSFVEAEILQAQGESYGLELFLKKNSGKVSGWLSYALTRTVYQTINNFDQESINNGERFRADFDRPHNLNLSLKFELSRLWAASSNFVFASGRPITLPTSSFFLNGNRILNVTERNNLRIPPTHRIDLSLTYEGTNKLKARWKSSLTFAIYNIYGRDNPFSIVTRSESNLFPRTYKLSVFGNIIPSVTYNFKFK